jgi:hypothetical protein
MLATIPSPKPIELLLARRHSESGDSLIGNRLRIARAKTTAEFLRDRSD